MFSENKYILLYQIIFDHCRGWKLKYYYFKIKLHIYERKNKRIFDVQKTQIILIEKAGV